MFPIDGEAGSHGCPDALARGFLVACHAVMDGQTLRRTAWPGQAFGLGSGQSAVTVSRHRART
jgi:hypothetical protein